MAMDIQEAPESIVVPHDFNLEKLATHIVMDNSYQPALDRDETEEYATSNLVYLSRHIAVVDCIGPWFSVGIHVDFRHKRIDIHFLWWVITLGSNVAEYEDIRYEMEVGE